MTMAAVQFNNVSIVFGNNPERALAMADQGKTRDEISAATGLVLGVANARLEQSLGQAIAAGARSATIFASCYLENDTAPSLPQRIAAMAREAGMPICGGNGMGFYNFDHRLRVCGFPPPAWVEGGGNKTLITHSGSAFSALVHHDHRFAYNLAVSPGQELGATCDEYLDFALDMPTTRVVGIFLETVRNADGFIAALEKARAKRIPIVVLKVGRTAESAKLAVSHSGAVAGDYAAYEAVFDRYGVVVVDTLTEFANALLLLGHDRRLPAGGLATMHDSGGLRELTVDRAVTRGVFFDHHVQLRTLFVVEHGQGLRRAAEDARLQRPFRVRLLLDERLRRRERTNFA